MHLSPRFLKPYTSTYSLIRQGTWLNLVSNTAIAFGTSLESHIYSRHANFLVFPFKSPRKVLIHLRACVSSSRSAQSRSPRSTSKERLTLSGPEYVSLYSFSSCDARNSSLTARMGRGRDSRQKGGGGGVRPPLPRSVQISKSFSWLLRHGGREKAGLDMDDGGWVNLAECVSLFRSLFASCSTLSLVLSSLCRPFFPPIGAIWHHSPDVAQRVRGKGKIGPQKHSIL